MVGKFVMLDTNVLIDLMRRERKALEKLKDFSGYFFCISYLVFIEFMAGSQLHEKQDARKFLQRFKLMPFDSRAQTESISFVNKYFTGRENKPMDLLIAAHAKSLNLPLIRIMRRILSSKK